MDKVKTAFSLKVLGVGCAVAVLAACAAPPPPPPPPPPPVQVVVPPRPYPPNGASPQLVLPAKGIDGVYMSVNRDISSMQALWNVRSAYNVGALNCPEPQRTEITNGYRAFLSAHTRTLANANRQVDAEFRKAYGRNFIPSREKYMTEVYNHFAFPPTLTAFCNAVAAMGRDAQAVPSKDLEAFAARSLPNIEIVFDDFYHRYAAYRAELAAWEASYGAIATPQLSMAGTLPSAP